MARLILTLGGQRMAEYNMTKERYTIGRLPDNDVRIDNPAVSGHHSLVINILNDSFLEDLNSTNGTYVNGKLVKKHALQSSDVITVGHHQLKFVSGGIEEEDDDEFARTMIIDSSQEAVQRSAARAAGLASGAYRQPNFDAPPRINAVADLAAPHTSDTPPRPRPKAVPTPAPASKPAQIIAPAKIQVLSGSMAGRDLEISKTLTTLGRPGEQVIAITKRGENHYIVQVERRADGPSAKVNGQEITGPARKLCDNDVIELLGVKMGFFTS